MVTRFPFFQLAVAAFWLVFLRLSVGKIRVNSGQFILPFVPFFFPDSTKIFSLPKLCASEEKARRGRDDLGCVVQSKCHLR